MKKTDVMLHFISGPEAGSSFNIEKAVSLGRSIEADITIADNRISRKHILISYKDDAWYLEDLDSSNGTWLGGERVTKAFELENLQHVRIGTSVFEIEFPDHDPNSKLRIFHSMDPLKLRKSEGFASDVTYPTEHRRLEAIYGMMENPGNTQDEQSIYPWLSRYLMREFQDARMCCVYMLDNESDYVNPTFGVNQIGDVLEFEQFPVGRKILNYICKKRRAVLCTYRAEDQNIMDSTVKCKDLQFLVAPLIHEKEMLGVVALVAPYQGHDLLFDEGDLQFLAGAAFSASQNIYNSRLYRRTIESERLAALGTTAASLSHYIKNILTGVDGCLYLMRMGIDDADEKLMNDAWGILSRNHKRLSSLVMDLLNLAKEPTLNVQPHCLSEVVVEVSDLVRQNYSNRKIELKLDPQFKLKSFVLDIDAMAIHRVMLNLLNNAADAVSDKFKDKGGGVIKVNVEMVHDSQLLLIEIVDNGSGIPDHMKNKIFDVFYTGKGEEGTGLGLAVSRRIVDAHNGSINFQSRDDGTTFSIRIPVQQKANNTRLIELPEGFFDR